jgi:hypothetical protein
MRDEIYNLFAKRFKALVPAPTGKHSKGWAGWKERQKVRAKNARYFEGLGRRASK